MQKEFPAGSVSALPGTTASWLALGLLGWAFASFGVLVITAVAGFTADWWVLILGFTRFVAGFASGVVALFAVIRRGERSVVCFGAIMLALLIALFAGGEIVVSN